MARKTVQDVHFDRLKLARHENLDGEAVAAWLKANRRLWDKFVFGTFDYITLFELRDLEYGGHACTLFLVAPKESVELIRAGMVADLQADEFGWWDEDGKVHEVGCLTAWDSFGRHLPAGKVLIRVWWD